jgi:ion channel-forming bestrophin family protein
MIEYNRYSWWKTALSFRGTALPRASGRILAFTIYATLVQVVYELGLDRGWIDQQHFLGLDPVGHAVVGSLLGFLITFRMNASNSRYWEGRSHWGAMINASRNLVRYGCQASTGGRELAALVAGYIYSLRQSLQGKRDFGEAILYLSPEQCRIAEKFGNRPTAISGFLSEWIIARQRNTEIDTVQSRMLEEQLGKLVDAQGGCEKIQKTPLPFAYVAMIKQLILVYLVTLPLVLCERCGWWSPLLMAIIALGLFGMEEASVETEDPFGSDDNCLDLEAYSLTIARDTGQLAANFPIRIDANRRHRDTTSETGSAGE